jgi:hypothetical protein
MRQPIPSTYKILVIKALNRDIDGSGKEWAMEMIQAGYEEESLYELAGVLPPYNQFELHYLMERVLKDLRLDYSDKSKTLKNYVRHLITTNIDRPNSYSEVLEELKDIYYEMNMDRDYQHFALLLWAKEDLQYGDHQFYWAGADKTNIDGIIRKQFEHYLRASDPSPNLSIPFQ